MKHLEFKRLLAGFLSVVMLFGTLSLGVLAADDADAIQPAADATADADRKDTQTNKHSSLDCVTEILSSLDYNEYLAQYPDAKAATTKIVIDSADYLTDADKTTAQVELGTYGNRKDVLYVGASGYITYRFEVQNEGLYTLSFDYLTTEDSTADIERVLYLDGKVPFSEARYLTIHRIWDDEYQYDENGNVVFEKDSTGSDLRPGKKQIFEWSNYRMVDSTGYVTSDLSLYLTKGTHEIRLESTRDPIVMDDITLGYSEKLRSYAEVEKEYERKGYQQAPEDAEVRIHAEKPYRTSTNTITATYDRTSAITDPQHYSQIRYNTIGNASTWNKVGTWVEWQFEVDQAGLYNIYTRFRQNVSVDMFTSRSLTIDGETPFEEAKSIRFPYKDDWQVQALGYTDDTGEYHTFQFYFEPGHTYTIRLEAALGDMAELTSAIQETVTPLNNIYLKILQITGAQPDQYQDYKFMDLIPDYMDMMVYQSNRIIDVMIRFAKINGYYDIAEKAQKAKDNGEKVDTDAFAKMSGISTLTELANLLWKMGTDEDEIAKGFATLKTDIGSLGTWVLDANEQPLELDYLQLQSAQAKEPQCDANMFQVLAYEFKQFIASFYSSYNTFDGDVTDSTKEADTVTIWYTGGRDQAQIYNRLLRNSFTAKTGINADLKLTVQDAILPAVLSGTGPDVTELDSENTITWAIRNALIPLDFDDLDEVKQRFSDQALAPFTLYASSVDLALNDVRPEGEKVAAETVYGIPTTMNFNLMYYRMDILKELNMEIPETWSDLRAMLPVLQMRYMDIGLPVYSTMYMLFLYQSDDNSTYWKDNGLAFNIDDSLNLSCFQDAVEMFTQYAFPVTYEFVNRFRTGEMPVGFADYTQYTYLSVFATEIRGLWDFSEVPGLYREDGTYSNVDTCSFKGISILRGAEYHKDDVWTYIKWLTDEPTQTAYGNELEAIIGTGNRYETANKYSLRNQSWTTSEANVIFSQMEKLRVTPQCPGSYIVTRYMDFAFNNAYNNGEDPTELMLSYLPAINKELSRKRKEYGMAYLETNETLEQCEARLRAELLDSQGK